MRNGFEESQLDSVESVVSPKKSCIYQYYIYIYILSKVQHMQCSLDVAKAVGPDGVSPHDRPLKNYYLGLCHLLFLLFHRVSFKAIMRTIFPASWKIARITCLFIIINVQTS